MKKGENASVRGKGHNPLAIANYIIKRANAEGRKLSIMQLVKLVYLAHGWCLGFGRGPLINTDVQAWRHGPVVVEVYKRFRPQGAYNIKKLAYDTSGNEHMAELEEGQQDIVDKVYDEYVRLHPFELSELTHARGTPWAQTDAALDYTPIPRDVIETYYKKRVEESRNEGWSE